MSVISTFTNTIDNIIIETRDLGDGVISVKTIYINDNSRSIECIILTTGKIKIITTGIKRPQIITPKILKIKTVIEKSIVEKKQLGRPKMLPKIEQELRTSLLKKILILKKDNSTSFPKKSDYIKKSNTDLLILINEMKNQFIEPIDVALNKILLFKKQYSLRTPLKHTYAKFSIDELDKLLTQLQKNQTIKEQCNNVMIN